MDFTRNMKLTRLISGILTFAVAVGLSGWDRYLIPSRISKPAAVTTAVSDTFEAQPRFAGDYAVIPAVQLSPNAAPSAATSEYYQPVLYRHGHWWRRNAPIIGGAAGGALIGGLLGGGAGAVIGGAAGGGGGYLYKRYHHRHHHYR